MNKSLRTWMPLVVVPSVAIIFGWCFLPPWATMWLFAFSLFWSFKWVTWDLALRDLSIENSFDPNMAIPYWRSLAYWFAWPGMNADTFLGDSKGKSFAHPTWTEWLVAMFCVVLGAWMLWWLVSNVPAKFWLLRGWIGLTGIVLVLHFGLFRLMSCFWRTRGLHAPPLMDNPAISKNLGEFWGKRWNTAFRVNLPFSIPTHAPRMEPSGKYLRGVRREWDYPRPCDFRTSSDAGHHPVRARSTDTVFFDTRRWRLRAAIQVGERNGTWSRMDWLVVCCGRHRSSLGSAIPCAFHSRRHPSILGIHRLGLNLAKRNFGQALRGKNRLCSTQII